jgi:hypothetical protein
MTQKTVITLVQLEEMYAAYLEKVTGKIVRPEHPIELCHAYYHYCKKSWTAWEQTKLKRMSQLAELEIAYTHEIDYYIDRKPIVPI